MADAGVQDVEENIVWTNGPAFDLDLAERTACTGHRKGPDPARTDVHVLLGLPGLCVGRRLPIPATKGAAISPAPLSRRSRRLVPSAPSPWAESPHLAHTRSPIDKGCEVEGWPCQDVGSIGADTLKRGQSSWAAPSAGRHGPFLGSKLRQPSPFRSDRGVGLNRHRS